MSTPIDLWVCPNCDILQGIEVKLETEVLEYNCVNCGIKLELSQISFLDGTLAKSVVEYIFNKIPEDLHTDIRFTWLSNRTVGIIFELAESELMEFIDFDVKSLIEDELADELELTTTVFFE